MSGLLPRPRHFEWSGRFATGQAREPNRFYAPRPSIMSRLRLSRGWSWRRLRSVQPHRRDQAVLAHRARSDEDVDLARLEHRLQVEAWKLQVCGRDRGPGGPRSAGTECELR